MSEKLFVDVVISEMIQPQRIFFFSSVVLMVVFSGLDLARLFSQNHIYFPY